MFGAFLKEVTGALDRRFVLTLFFPSLLFWAGLFLVYASTDDVAGLIAAWGKQSVELRTVEVVAAVVWVAFFSYVLSNQALWLTQQFEGYWNWPLGKRLRAWRKRHYIEVLEQLAAQGGEAYSQIYACFPFPEESDQVMPTRLGNILKSAELYPKRQYGVDSVLLWPRLYPLLPESFAGGVAETKSSLDLMLVLSALSAIFAFAAGVALLIRGGPWWLFPACFCGGLILAYTSYTSALRAAGPYAQLIKSAFDLYRGDLIDKLGFERPKSLEEEVRFWDNLGKQLYRFAADEPDLLRYKGSEPKDKTPPPEPAVIAVAIEEGDEDEVLDKQKFAVVTVLGLAATAGAGFLRRQSDVAAIPVPARSLPAYTRISQNDLTMAKKPASNLPKDTVLTIASLEGRYLKSPLATGDPIPKTALVPGDPPAAQPEGSTVAIPLDATAALAFGGQLKSGEFVTVWDQSQNRVLLKRALVLDVMRGTESNSDGNHSEPYVVVLAVPVEHQADVIAAAGHRQLAFTR
jgi:Flp pilus assembly protein CpaB